MALDTSTVKRARDTSGDEIKTWLDAGSRAIQAVGIADDLDTIGEWTLQVHIVTASGNWKSDIGAFIVHDNLA